MMSPSLGFLPFTVSKHLLNSEREGMVGGGNSSGFNHNSIDGLHPEKLPLTQDCYIQSNINKKSNKELPLNRFGLRIAVRGSNCIINETKDEQRTLGNCFECAYGLM